ncbi:MAG: hypothetical protein PHR28_02285 [candidate division Zixibacteria bacterium]|nr:hypothetical protein [candidate division Zixibacteria bacterium]
MARHWIRRLFCAIAACATIVMAFTLIDGCGSAQLVNLWQDPSYTVTPMHKIMVMAMRKDPLTRRMWEDAFVAGAADKSTVTKMVASYQLFPNEMPDPSAMDTLVAKEGFDGVLIVAKIELETTTNEMPGYVTDEQVTEYHPRWNTYVTRYEKIYHPSYADTTTTVSVRTDLLLANDQGRLIWSATSESIDPLSREEVRDGVVGTATKQMRKSGFIQ